MTNFTKNTIISTYYKAVYFEGLKPVSIYNHGALVFAEQIPVADCEEYRLDLEEKVKKELEEKIGESKRLIFYIRMSEEQFYKRMKKRQ